jgi:hypothetical protein
MVVHALISALEWLKQEDFDFHARWATQWDPALKKQPTNQLTKQPT